VKREAGFSLIELLVAFLLFLFGVLLAGLLLRETSRRMHDGYARDLEAPVASARARLRADLEAAAHGRCERDAEGVAIALRAVGHPSGTVVYHLEEGTLWRFLEAEPTARARVLVGLTGFACADSGPLVGIELSGRRRALRRSPLVVAGQPLAPSEPWVETLWVAPRGAGRWRGW
jgi:hypothetical protein